MKIKDAMRTSKTHWFEQVLNNQMLEEHRAEKAKQVAKNLDHFRPSMAHQCPRAIWYARKGYEGADIKVNSLWRMALGTLIHEMIETMAKKTPAFESAEQDLSLDLDDVYVLGHYDMIVKNPMGEFELMELKSYAPPKPGSRYKLVLPKDEHIDQWNSYSYLSSLNNNVPDVTKGFIMYINKATQEFKFYNQERDERRVTRLIAKMQKIQKYIDKDRPYPYQPNENHNWCDFKKQCESDYYIKGI